MMNSNYSNLGQSVRAAQEAMRSHEIALSSTLRDSFSELANLKLDLSQNMRSGVFALPEISKAYETIWQDAMRAFERQHLAIDLSQSAAAIAETLSFRDPLIEEMATSLAPSIEQLTKVLRFDQGLGAIPALGGIRFSLDAQLAGAFETAFAELTRLHDLQTFSERFSSFNLDTQIREIEETESAEARAELFDRLLRWLVEALPDLPRSRATFLAAVKLLYFLLPIYSLIEEQLDEGAEAEYRSELEERQAERFRALALAIDSLKPDSFTRKGYVVTGHVVLRAGPSTKSKRLGVLAPNTFLEEVDREGHWLEVEFFNFSNGDLSRGWVYQRYLAPVGAFDSDWP